MNRLDDLLHPAWSSAPMPQENTYLEAWLQHVHGPLRTEVATFSWALSGGMLADRLAWVFIAGYQAALRATFPEVAFKGWCAFVASEDRSEVDPLPGVVWRAEGEEYCLAGHKTWVAACDHVHELVVTARSTDSDETAFFLVDRGTPGLSLRANPAPSMLPDLSQGRAQLADVRLPRSAKLDGSRVAGFGHIEALHIYIAFLGMIHRRAGPWGQSFGEMSYDALTCAREIDPYNMNIQALVVLDERVQTLRRALSTEVFAADQVWQRDQRLIAMYSKGIQSRRA